VHCESFGFPKECKLHPALLNHHYIGTAIGHMKLYEYIIPHAFDYDLETVRRYGDKHA
jgi:hypothetical protein